MAMQNQNQSALNSKKNNSHNKKNKKISKDNNIKDNNVKNKNAGNTSKKSKEIGKNAQITTWPMYILIILLFFIYIILQHNPMVSVALGIVLFALIIILVAIESINIMKENKSSRKKDIIEIVAALIIVGVIFLGLDIALGTYYPLDVVPSCSMLPVLQRGDLVVLSGRLHTINAPIVNVTQSMYSSFIKNFSTNTVRECVSYNYSSHSIDQFFDSGDAILLIQLNDSTGRYFIVNQSKSLIKYYCGTRTIKYFNGTTKQVAYTNSIKIGNRTISTDANNTIIVYKTVPNDSFYRMGDTFIVHRVFAIINVSGTYYYLTKGDNNPALDLQYGNYPSNASLIEGKVIAAVPYLGYLKLVLSRSIEEPYGCNFTTIHRSNFSLT